MIITQESQLGLRFKESDAKIEFLKIIRMYVNGRMSSLSDEIKFFNEHEGSMLNGSQKEIMGLYEENIKNFPIAHLENDLEIRERVTNKCVNSTAFKDTGANAHVDFFTALIEENKDSKYFFICESVYKAAELIRIGENFTSRTMKDIALGHYTYLMGKNQMVRFVVAVGAIKGFYYNDAKGIAFEFGLDLETGEYYYPKENQKEFSMLMQVLVFVELGEIETVYLEGGRNNGKSKNGGKVTNASKNTIHVVDSSWNKLIIRTEGFSVSPHWRLQPCGPGHADRILILINAFWKNGYKRLPKAEMARSVPVRV